MIRRLFRCWRVRRRVAGCCSWKWHAGCHSEVMRRERALDQWVCQANQQHAQDVADAFWQQLNDELRERGE